MFLNITPAVAMVAEVNNYLLPLWMIVFGVSLLRSGRTPAAVAVSPIVTADAVAGPT
jgi:hypothetical protein